MSEISKETSGLSRRGFMRMAGVSAGAAGALVVGLDAKPVRAAGEAAHAASVGYRETEHVKTYYAHARL